MPTFTKAERLSSKVAIDVLMDQGRAFNIPPFRVIWKEVPEQDIAVKVLISVPKRIFKRAVDRNLLKRRIREQWRLEKQALSAELEGKKIQLGIIYTSRNIMVSEEIKMAMKALVEKLQTTLKK